MTIDIIDYPGEWLLDLPLLGKSFAQWSRETIEASAAAGRAALAAPWRAGLSDLAPDAKASETVAREQAERFTAYLQACRDDRYALSTLPPGRFLMPGELAGSPALTFAPLQVAEGQTYGANSLAAMMERRFEAYKTHVVKPFFRDHFSRLDRQIVLVDALSALNSGPSAVRDLQTALTDVMQSFPGELPADPRRALRGDALAMPEDEADYRFVKFRPPPAELGDDGLPRPLPHIRLDRALQFLLGDKLA